MPRARQRLIALTLIEVLVVVAILAIVAGSAYALSRPSLANAAARALRTMILWARTEAMWRGQPVSVLEGAGGFVAAVAHDPSRPCEGGTAIANVALAEYPGVRVGAGLPRGLVWLPSGSGRSCSGGGVISATIALHGGAATVHVVVSSLGRVRVESP